MSTRCVVRIKEKQYGKVNKLDIYHHHDGYIEGVGFDLMRRFYDKDKKEMYLYDVMQVANTLIKDIHDEYKVTPYKHGDIEYFYEIDIDKKTITAWSVNNWEEKMKKYRKYSHNEILKMYLKEV